MKQIFAFWTVFAISFFASKPIIAAGAPGVGDKLSLSVTNKYGDVLANPTVGQVLGDGLILERGTLAMKVKYDDLPPGIRGKYQPLAARAVQEQEQEGVADAAYLDYTRQLQAQQAQHLAAQEAAETELAKERPQEQPTNAALHYVIIAIPNQNWKLTIANLGFETWTKVQDNPSQYVVRGQSDPGGFNLVLFVDAPANNQPGNDAAYSYFWSPLARDPLIDGESLKVEHFDRFIKVSYTVNGQRNVNYFFAYQGRWVDIHLSKGTPESGDDKLFAAFQTALSYGP